jgi:hypothetical protein
MILIVRKYSDIYETILSVYVPLNIFCFKPISFLFLAEKKVVKCKYKVNLATKLFLIQLHTVYCKKRLATFPSPAEMSLTKLSLGGNGDGNVANLFLQCITGWNMLQVLENDHLFTRRLFKNLKKNKPINCFCQSINRLQKILCYN